MTFFAVFLYFFDKLKSKFDFLKKQIFYDSLVLGIEST